MNPVLTYRNLKEALAELTEEQLDMNVSVLMKLNLPDDEIELHNIKETITADCILKLAEEFDLEPNLPLLIVGV